MFSFLLPILWLTVVPGSEGTSSSPTPVTFERAETLVSAVLPDTLAGFVKRSGRDRPLSELPTEMVEELQTGDPGAETVLEVLQPASYLELCGPVTLLDLSLTEGSESHKGNAPVSLLAAGIVFLDEGIEVELGTELDFGCTITRGLLLNAGDSSVGVETREGVTEWRPGGVISVQCDPCSVECGTGYYACCYHDSKGCPRCKCKANGTSDVDCESGGQGATSCSLGKTQ